MVDFTELIREKVEAINLTLEVKDTDGVRIDLCKTLFLRPGKIITDEGGNTYKVTDFLDNEWIDVEPVAPTVDPFAGLQVICQPVYYLHGTPSSVNDEYRLMAKSSKNKTPMIWLNENYTIDFEGPGSSVEFETSPRIFFMDVTREQDWTNEEHHKLCIKPMMNLAEEFYLTFKSDRRWKRLNPVTQIPRPRFGVYQDNRGNDRKIIDEFLSAVETQPSLIKYKEGCKC